jgi:hypothetical protein
LHASGVRLAASPEHDCGGEAAARTREIEAVVTCKWFSGLGQARLETPRLRYDCAAEPAHGIRWVG